MHIALSSPAWPPQRYPNGIVTYVRWMREEFERQGHRVSVFTPVLDPGDSESGIYLVAPSLFRRLQMKIDTLLHKDEPAEVRWGKAIADALRAVDKVDPIDIIEIEESFGWVGDVLRSTSLPVVIKLHGPAFLTSLDEELRNPLVQCKILKEGEAISLAKAVTSPSKYTIDHTLAYYRITPKIGEHVVNPVSLEAGCPMWSLDNCDRQSILFVGRFDRLKGADLMLLAFRKLLDQNSNLKLVFVGPDTGIHRPDSPPVYFEAFRDEHFPPELRGRIDFKGRLGPTEINRLRTEAMVTVVASRFENQSYAALEAMLQGCPVVSMDAGGQTEIIDHEVTGLVSRPGDVDDLARQVSRMLASPADARTMGERARKYVLSVHAPSKVAEATLSVYRRLISGEAVEPA